LLVHGGHFAALNEIQAFQQRDAGGRRAGDANPYDCNIV
jgi:hypothetical protein